MQFLHQEPNPPAEIKRLYRARGYTGFILQKGKVNGRGALPLYNFVKVSSGDTRLVQWNYEKYLVGRDGRVHGRYGSKKQAIELKPDIAALLAPVEEGANSAAAARA